MAWSLAGVLVATLGALGVFAILGAPRPRGLGTFLEPSPSTPKTGSSSTRGGWTRASSSSGSVRMVTPSGTMRSLTWSTASNESSGVMSRSMADGRAVARTLIDTLSRMCSSVPPSLSAAVESPM